MESRLTAITVVTAIGLVISGLAVQHEALLRRQMRYFALAGISLFLHDGWLCCGNLDGS